MEGEREGREGEGRGSRRGEGREGKGGRRYADVSCRHEQIHT